MFSINLHIRLTLLCSFLKISFNKEKVFQIENRKSLDNVKLLHIYGNITLKSIKIIHSSKEGNQLVRVTCYFVDHLLTQKFSTRPDYNQSFDAVLNVNNDFDIYFRVKT